MRAPILTSLAILALLCQGYACSAQSQPTDKSGAPQTLTGPGGSDQRNSPSPGREGQAVKDKTLSQDAASPKKEATEHGKPRGRVGTLSPDEERRADRARKRASGKAASDRVTGIDRGREARDSRPSDERGVAVERQRAKVVTNGRRTAPRTRISNRADRRTALGPDIRRDRGSVGVSPGPRRLAEENWRGPRVGDVVAPRVRLYPLPPAYGVGGPAYYVPRPGYATATELPPPYMRRRDAEPGFPPYPRYRYDDDEDVDE